jgi:hypothetical protein
MYYTFQYKAIHPTVNCIIHGVSCNTENINLSQLGNKWLIWEFNHGYDETFMFEQYKYGINTYKLYLDNCCNLWAVISGNYYGEKLPDIQIVPAIHHQKHEISEYHMTNSLIDEIITVLKEIPASIPQHHSMNSPHLPSASFFDIYTKRAEISWDNIHKRVYNIDIKTITAEGKEALINLLKFDMELGEGDEETFIHAEDITAELVIQYIPELIELYDGCMPYSITRRASKEYILENLNNPFILWDWDGLDENLELEGYDDKIISYMKAFPNKMYESYDTYFKNRKYGEWRQNYIINNSNL